MNSIKVKILVWKVSNIKSIHKKFIEGGLCYQEFRQKKPHNDAYLRTKRRDVKVNKLGFPQLFTPLLKS